MVVKEMFKVTSTDKMKNEEILIKVEEKGTWWDGIRESKAFWSGHNIAKELCARKNHRNKDRGKRMTKENEWNDW